MDTKIESPVRRQVQSTQFYCGAACAVMMLSRKDQIITQDAAYEIIRRGDAEPNAFYTDPDGLETCLDSILSATDFEDLISDSKATILQMCLSTLSLDGRPVPILVRNGNHWVLIDGMIIEKNPDKGPPKIKMLAIVDPWPQATDRSFIPADAFAGEYLTPVRYGTKWKGKMVIVRQKNGGSIGAISTAEQQPMGGGTAVDDTLLIKNLNSLGLPQISPVLGGGLSFSPVKVQDLSKEFQYTIFPLDGINSNEFADFILVAADSFNGVILEVAKFSHGFNYFSDTEALAIVNDQIYSGNVVIQPGYFFFESRQLRSRFLVARRILVDGNEHWLMPNGVLMANRDEPKEGGQ